MKIIVDANVFMIYFQEFVLKIKLQNTAKHIFDAIGNTCCICFDKGNFIIKEWENVSGDTEWIKAWLEIRLLNGEAELITVNNKYCKNIIDCLVTNNRFPRQDVWYIKTAVSTANLHGSSCIYSNDLHFYDPIAKKYSAQQQDKIRRCCKGPIVKILKPHNVTVKSTYQ